MAATGKKGSNSAPLAPPTPAVEPADAPAKESTSTLSAEDQARFDQMLAKEKELQAKEDALTTKAADIEAKETTLRRDAAALQKQMAPKPTLDEVRAKHEEIVAVQQKALVKVEEMAKLGYCKLIPGRGGAAYQRGKPDGTFEYANAQGETVPDPYVGQLVSDGAKGSDSAAA